MCGSGTLDWGDNLNFIKATDKSKCRVPTLPAPFPLPPWYCSFHLVVVQGIKLKRESRSQMLDFDANLFHLFKCNILDNFSSSVSVEFFTHQL